MPCENARNDFQLDEAPLLTGWALRFDGYKYTDEHPYPDDDGMDTFRRTGDWSHMNDLEKLTAFFRLQRYLFKWGGEYLSQRSVTWRAFRQLFLDTADLPIPENYRMREWYEKWATDLAPRRDECVALVAEIHRRTNYADDDVLHESLGPFAS